MSVISRIGQEFWRILADLYILLANLIQATLLKLYFYPGFKLGVASY
jgi:hypothetical protein